MKDGGDGFDYVSWYTSTSGVTVNLQNPAKSTGGAKGDTVINVEAFYLSAFNDVFADHPALHASDFHMA